MRWECLSIRIDVGHPTSDARPATAELLWLVGIVVAPSMDHERAAREIG